jgi:hypothetical protein
MSDKDIFDLTRTMEGLIDESLSEVDIMQQLLMAADGANATKRFDRFRIGDEVYSLEDLYKIQELEEHEALVERHRTRI